MWNLGHEHPFSPPLTDPAFRPWRGPIPRLYGDDVSLLGAVLGAFLAVAVVLVWSLGMGILYACRGVVRVWGRHLLIVLIMGGLLTGCQAMSREILKLEGCDMRAVDYGYCHMPKEVKR